MLLKKLTYLSLPLIVFLFFSCSKDNEDTLINENTYIIPSTYDFSRNGATSVDYSGQRSRLLMLEEIGNYIKNKATEGTIIDKTVLNNMFSNTNNSFTLAELNTSGKQLKDKTAASKDYFSLFFGGGSTTEQINARQLFEKQFQDAHEASLGRTAEAGVAGVYIDGTTKRLFAANGLEPQQVVLKGMMGACLLDQIVNNYLSLKKLDEGSNIANNTAKVLETGKSYTTMEHYWDEGYGYIVAADDLSVTPNKLKFWSSYIDQVNADSDFKTLKEDIKKAFIKGRAAIVANDYATRNAQIDIIKSKLALIPAVRAVYYLQDGKAKLTTDNGAKAFHALSEAYGFIMSLRYTNKPGTDNPYFSKTEVDNMLQLLTSGTNGLWDINNLPTKLNTISEQIASKFGFTVSQAATVN